MPSPQISAYPVAIFKARDLKIMKTGYHNDNFLFFNLVYGIHVCVYMSFVCVRAHVRVCVHVCVCEERETERLSVGLHDACVKVRGPCQTSVLTSRPLET